MKYRTSVHRRTIPINPTLRISDEKNRNRNIENLNFWTNLLPWYVVLYEKWTLTINNLIWIIKDIDIDGDLLTYSILSRLSLSNSYWKKRSLSPVKVGSH